MALLIKFWKSPPELKSKKEIKKLAIEKCIRYVPKFDENKVKRSPEIKKMVERIWKAWKIDGDNPSELRTINSIGFSKDVLDWFLNLEENFVIDDEKKMKMQEMRFPARISNHPMTFTRTRFLFTLFVWASIQNQYANGLYHNIDKCMKKLRADGDLPTSFNILNERNILEDLGFIKTTDKNVDLILDFIEKEPIFSIPITKENEIKIEGLDLYDCGKWLEKQKYGFYVCQNCGKEIIKKSNPKGGRPNKYCPECAKKIIDGVTMNLGGSNYVTKCERCGKEIKLASKYSSHGHYCWDCRDEMNLNRVKNFKENNEINVSSRKTPDPQTLDT